MRYSEITEAATAYSGYNIQSKYAEFNRRYFGGELPQIKLGIAPVSGVYGVTKFQTTKTTPPRVDPASISITLSNAYPETVEQIDGTLLHEMIHVHFALTGILGDAHGPAFKAMADHISRASGFPIRYGHNVKSSNPSDLVTKQSIPLGVVFLQNSFLGPYAFALMSVPDLKASMPKLAAFWKSPDQAKNAETITFVEIKTPIWSALAALYPLQGADKLGYHPVPNEATAHDLLTHGHILGHVEKGS